MPHKPKPQPDDPEEYKRFLETAKAVEAEEDAEVFDLVFSKIVPPRKPKPKVGPVRPFGLQDES